eukprot:SM000289S10409  [mRNA]  locus=s289:23283:25677:+ [translate_table: standard]
MVPPSKPLSRSKADSNQVHCHPTPLPPAGCVASGSRDGCIMLWDLRDASAAATASNTQSCSSIVAVVAGSAMTSSALFPPGHADADSRMVRGSSRPVAVVRDAHAGAMRLGSGRARRGSRGSVPARHSVTSVLHLLDERLLASTGASDGAIKIWDQRNLGTAVLVVPGPQGTTSTSSHGSGDRPERVHGFASLAQDRSGTRLLASCADHTIYMYDTLRLEAGPAAHFSGHACSSFFVKVTYYGSCWISLAAHLHAGTHADVLLALLMASMQRAPWQAAFSPDGAHVLSGSGCGRTHIWETARPGAPSTMLEGHVGEVMGVDWCHGDAFKVATCADDHTASHPLQNECMFTTCPDIKHRFLVQQLGRSLAIRLLAAGRPCDYVAGDIVQVRLWDVRHQPGNPESGGNTAAGTMRKRVWAPAPGSLTPPGAGSSNGNLRLSKGSVKVPVAGSPGKRPRPPNRTQAAILRFLPSAAAIRWQHAVHVPVPPKFAQAGQNAATHC